MRVGLTRKVGTQDYIYESQEREVNTAGLRLRKLRKQRKKKVKAAATSQFCFQSLSMLCEQPVRNPWTLIQNKWTSDLQPLKESAPGS